MVEYKEYMLDKWVPAMYIIHIKQKVDFISKPDQDSQRIKYIYNYKYINFTAVCKIRLQWFQWIFWKLWEKLPVYVISHIHVYPKCY